MFLPVGEIVDSFKAAFCGLMYVVYPKYRRMKHDQWKLEDRAKVRMEVIGWIVCAVMYVVIGYFLHRLTT
jgi:hypothetical protein